jgi:cation transport ATPase
MRHLGMRIPIFLGSCLYVAARRHLEMHRRPARLLLTARVTSSSQSRSIWVRFQIIEKNSIVLVLGMPIVFLHGGRYLDQATKRKTRAFAANLSALRVSAALRIGPNGGMTAVPVAALAAGGFVLAGAGERIPVGGIIVSGCSEIDQSFVTGETAGCKSSAGSEVYAGTLNFNGTLRIRARVAAGGTLIDEIERLMEAATTQRTRYVRLADRAARFYAPVVHATALLTAIGGLLAGASAHDAIVTAITVLIITCPCALALAVPAIQAVASGALFRSRVLLGRPSGSKPVFCLYDPLNRDATERNRARLSGSHACWLAAWGRHCQDPLLGAT